MPIHLRAPSHQPGGPDGQGWNRLSLNAHISGDQDQCALRPRSFATLWESQSTTRARWGGYSPCASDGRCTDCPVFAALDDDPKWLPAHTDRVLVRLKESDNDGGGWLGAPAPVPYVVDDPDAGWASPRYRWTWTGLRRLRGWRVGRAHRDEHSDGFWLHKHDPNQLYGTERTDQ